MIFAFILIFLLGLILLLFLTNVKIKIKYNNDLKIDFYYGWFKIPQSLLNRTQKEEQPKSQTDNSKQEKKKENKLFNTIKKKGVYESFVEILEFLSPVLKEVQAFLKNVKIDPLKIDIKMVGDDAAKLAIDYGKFCAVYYPIVELVESTTKCKNINSNVYVNYVDKTPSVFIKTEITFRLIFGIVSGIKIINLFTKFKEKFN